MALPSGIANKINTPVTNVLGILEALAQPRGFGLAAPGDSSAVYGTPSAARRNFKPFIVGLIPPDVPVDFIPFKRSFSGLAPIEADSIVTAAGSSVAASSSGDGHTRDTLTSQFWINYVQMCDRLKVDPEAVAKVWFSESGLNPNKVAIRNGRPVAKGLNQITRAAGGSVGVTSEQWDSYENLSGTEQLPYIETFMKKTGQSNGQTAEQMYSRNFGGFRLPGFEGPCYMSKSTFAGLPPDRQDAVRKACGKQLDFMFLAYEQNKGLEKGRGVVGALEVGQNVSKLSLPPNVKNNIANAQLSVANGAQSVTPAPAATPAAAAEPEPDASAVVDPNRAIMTVGSVTELTPDAAGDRVGKLTEYDPSRARVAQQQTDALRRQIAIIAATPGLLMMVNPSEFSRAFEASVDNSVKGRTGNIVHVWLEKPAAITCSGVTAGQYVVDAEGNGGITGQLRVYSASYQNLLSLLAVYKTNGIIYSGSGSQPNVAQLGYSVFIYYDNFIYVGSFDSFEVQDSDQKPHNMAYSFKFTVRYFFDVGNDGRFTDFEIGVNNDFRGGSR